MAHKHWPADHPYYELAPTCDLPTKKACDERWTQYLHFHLGTPCEKRVEPGNKVATCILRPGADERGMAPSRDDRGAVE